MYAVVWYHIPLAIPFCVGRAVPPILYGVAINEQVSLYLPYLVETSISKSHHFSCHSHVPVENRPSNTKKHKNAYHLTSEVAFDQIFPTNAINKLL